MQHIHSIDQRAYTFLSVFRGTQGCVDVRELRVTVVCLSILNQEDRYRGVLFRICLEDLFEQPLPIDFRATPAFVTILFGD